MTTRVTFLPSPACWKNTRCKVLSADNGRDAIALLQEETEDVDIVLMDIMMPEMDGAWKPSREIRKIGKLKNLPIVAVTAKAMKGDREKCRGRAWDYLSKPVDTEQMITVLRALAATLRMEDRCGTLAF